MWVTLSLLNVSHKSNKKVGVGSKQGTLQAEIVEMTFVFPTLSAYLLFSFNSGLYLLHRIFSG